MNAGARSKIAWVIATWFGCGRLPKAPGTMGALGAIPLYLLVVRGGRPGVALAAIGVTAIGVWAASVVAHEIGKKDPQIVVVDEVAGMLVTMLPMQVVSWQAVLAGFAAFRLFDVVKPWPVRSFEKLPGGWGIVLDDVVAGMFGAGVLTALRVTRVLP
jgi:phosphatidylglycerophosphatase A